MKIKTCVIIVLVCSVFQGGCITAIIAASTGLSAFNTLFTTGRNVKAVKDYRDGKKEASIKKEQSFESMQKKIEGLEQKIKDFEDAGLKQRGQAFKEALGDSRVQSEQLKPFEQDDLKRDD